MVFYDVVDVAAGNSVSQAMTDFMAGLLIGSGVGVTFIILVFAFLFFLDWMKK